MRVKRLPLYLLAAAVLLSCTAAPTRTLQPTLPPSWQDIPIMSGAVASPQLTTVAMYEYTINVDMRAAEQFYLERMKTSGWDLLGKSDTSVGEVKALALWFSKGEAITTIDIWEKDGTTYVAIVPER